MTQTYYPFATGAGANVTENQWNPMAALWRSTGVITPVLNNLAVSADGTGMWVYAASGAGWIVGQYYQNSASVTLAIAASDPTNPRIDRIVLHADYTAKTIGLLVLTGTPAGSPSVPALTQSSTIWEIPLATVLVSAGVATIAAIKVTDDRQFSDPPIQADNTIVYPTSRYMEDVKVVPLATNLFRIPYVATAPAMLTIGGRLCVATANIDLAVAPSGGAALWYLFANRVGNTFTLTASASSTESGNRRIGEFYWTGAAVDYASLIVYGMASAPNVYYASVSRVAVQSIGTSAWTSLSFDTEGVDTDGMYAAGSPTRITIIHPGIYVLTGNVWWGNSAGDRQAKFLLNGATEFGTIAVVNCISGARITTTAIRFFSAGDYVELQTWQNSGGVLNSSGDFTVAALSA